jgi:hypothetical protein
MFGKKGPPPPEDPAVAPVEALLRKAATFRDVSGLRNGPVSTTHALWVCACVTTDEAPIWLVYEEKDSGTVWCRVPDEADIEDIVDAERIAGGHADPGDVLDWLEGAARDPWSGNGCGDGGVLDLFDTLRRI